MNFRTGQRWTTLSSKPNSYQSMGDLLTSRRKPSILVVDDHPENAMELGELLSTRSYRIVSAQDAATFTHRRSRFDEGFLYSFDGILNPSLAQRQELCG